MRILGIDLGTKNIGVAVSDETCTIAGGVGVVKRISNVKAVERICEIIKEYDAKEIIIGYPINMDGSIGVRAIDAEKFSQKIKESSGIEVKLWDERLSTKEAENFMIKASVTRKKRKKVIDKLAAVIILQGYLDSR